MSQAAVLATGTRLAQVVSALSNPMMQCQESAVDSIVVGFSAILSPLLTVAGLLSKSFVDNKAGSHPNEHADAHSMLFAALLLSRSCSPVVQDGKAGALIELSPEIFADVITDFGKLMPLVSVDSFIRSDLLQAARSSGDNVIPLAGILSKRPSPDTSH